MKNIDSSSNSIFKVLRTLVDSKGIKKENHFFVFGKNPIHDTLKTSFDHARYILATQEMSDEAHRLNHHLPTRGETLFLAKPLFEELNLFGIDYPILVCESPKFEIWPSGTGPIVVCPFGNPQNLGAALRSALAFDLTVVLTKESAHPLNPRCMRALSGNIFAHTIKLGPSIQELPMSPNLVVLDKTGTDISKFKFSKDSILVIGEEGLGIPPALQSAKKISIPISHHQESLNAMAALSIAAYAYRSQFPLA